MTERIITDSTAQPEQEPLFWYRPCGDGMYEGPVHANSVGGKMLRDEKPDEWTPLYTTPPQRKPLTDEEIDGICVQLGFAQLSPGEVARAIEAAHNIQGATMITVKDLMTSPAQSSPDGKHWEPALPHPGWPFWKTRLKDALAVWQGKAIAVRQTTKADIKDGT